MENIGFRLESICHKHKIIQERNRDSAVYVITNADWPEIESNLRIKCSLPKKTVKLHNIAEIETIEELVESFKYINKNEEEEEKEEEDGYNNTSNNNSNSIISSVTKENTVNTVIKDKKSGIKGKKKKI